MYLTGGRLLRITPEELLRFDLRPGMDLAEDVLEELNRAAARSLTRQQAAEMAGRRMLSRKYSMLRKPYFHIFYFVVALKSRSVPLISAKTISVIRCRLAT